MKNILATQPRYNRPAIAFHWLIVLLVALGYLAIEIRGPKGTDSRLFWTNVHFCAGTLVLSLSILRVLWRFASRRPDPLPQPPVLAFLAKLSHLALYLFTLAQPLLGIAFVNMGGHPVTIAPLGVSFTLFDANPALRGPLKEAHELIGNSFYFVIGLHALAALWHHFVKRDATLRRILP
ncbi:cytochrome b [Burkholderia gladioli]|jgi:cytochrome b561|uniref:cytochrome b n=1 Tax=Burkholderia gladioli TaxID=28095 RepID=UPI000D001288|nr:cytochrome b [Burkholderia gladioli]MBA1363371.1 cytochrome b [Burkholderia gladioli]MCA8166737.1 cytochrome b [Burkholderia gladioli]PRE80244.1 cytochrome B [Burkholderia gladioli]